MRYRLGLTLLAALLAASCTTTSNTPATAPPTTEITAQGDSTSTTGFESASPTTTTLPPASRDETILAMFQELESRRMFALYSGDSQGLAALYAPSPYLDRTLGSMDEVEGSPPQLLFTIEDVLRDDDECLVFTYTVEDALTDSQSSVLTVVLERHGETYRYLYASPGTGTWLCDGPHPLEK